MTAVSPPATVYIALGSNLGDRTAHLTAALTALGAHGTIEAVSAFYDTAPVGYTDQPRFLNAVARLLTHEQPQDLLHSLLEIEATQGRVRRERWGPRTLDLDMLLYNDLVLSTPALTLPHPRMHERLFVLEPLATLAPDLIHPQLGRSISTVMANLMSNS